MTKWTVPQGAVPKLLMNFDYFETAVLNISEPVDLSETVKTPNGEPILFIALAPNNPLLVRPDNSDWGKAWIIPGGVTEFWSISLECSKLWVSNQADPVVLNVMWGW